MIKKSATLLGLSALTFLSSCATIMHGTRQSIGISSYPSNASIWVDRNFVGNTPMIVEMSRKDNHIVQIALEGYLPYEATFTREVSGWVFGNLVFGGVIGLAVDAVSGGIYRLTPEDIQAELQANHMAYSKKTGESCILVVLEPNKNWEKIGNLQLANQ